MLEQGKNQNHFVTLRNPAETIRQCGRYPVRQIEKRRVLLPAEIFRQEKLLRADDFRAVRGGFRNQPFRHVRSGSSRTAVSVLKQSNPDLVIFHHHSPESFSEIP